MEANKSPRDKWSMVARNWAEVSWEEIAATLRDDHAEYLKHYKVKGGVRDQKYQLLQGNYLMYLKLKNDPVEFERFKADPYWRGFHQPPTDDNLMLSVLTYNMQSKDNEPIQNLNYKYAKVLMSFDADNVIPDSVAQRLKDGGGPHFIYAQICKSEKGRREGESDHAEYASTAIVAAEPNNNAANDGDKSGDEYRDEAEGATGTESSDGGEGAQSADQGQREPAAMQRAANDQPDGFEEEDESLPPKQGRLDVINFDIELAVEMEQPHQVEMVLNSTGGLLRYRRCPPDKRGFKRITAYIVKLDGQGEAQQPDKASDDSA